MVIPRWVNRVGALMALCGLVLTAGPGEAHVGPVKACAVLGAIHGLKPMGEPVYDSSNGLLLELYDKDGDGMPDFGTLSHTKAVTLLPNGSVKITHDPFPLFYIVGKGPDRIYIDKVGRGRCQDIVLYEDLQAPRSSHLQHDQLTNAEKGRGI